jgi:hypothetical protein
MVPHVAGLDDENHVFGDVGGVVADALEPLLSEAVTVPRILRRARRESWTMADDE